MSDTITIQGAVLERSDAARPYADSQPISISELELTAPGEGEILVKITAAGICHSDLSVVNNNRPRPLPMLLGHESAGVVEEVGRCEQGEGRRPCRHDLPPALRRVRWLQDRRKDAV